MNELDWRWYAACSDEDPELFFPIGISGPALLQADRAKDVCAMCPVKAECLAEALAMGATGVWGGTTEGERRVMTAERMEKVS